MPKAKKINKCKDCGSENCEKKLGAYLCNLCSNKDENTYMTKTRIKSEFFLNDKDLENVNNITTKNPHYRSQSMYLYNLYDAKKKFVEKYGDDEPMEEKQQKLLLKKIERGKRVINSKEKITDTRKKLLETKMAEKRLEIRSDSKLCAGFINGTIKEDVDDVVERMCQVKYLFDYCHMDDCFEIAKKEQRDEIKAGYYPDEPLFDHAERIALKKCGGYPEVYPWLE